MRPLGSYGRFLVAIPAGAALAVSGLLTVSASAGTTAPAGAAAGSGAAAPPRTACRTSATPAATLPSRRPAPR